MWFNNGSMVCFSFLMGLALWRDRNVLPVEVVARSFLCRTVLRRVGSGPGGTQRPFKIRCAGTVGRMSLAAAGRAGRLCLGSSDADYVEVVANHELAIESLAAIRPHLVRPVPRNKMRENKCLGARFLGHRADVLD